MAHNLKAAGSNPAPATKFLTYIKRLEPDVNRRVFALRILVNTWSTFDQSPIDGTAFRALALRNLLWQHRAMIMFRALPDDHPDLKHSPLLRAALLTLRYAQEHGAIGLTKTMGFKRVFVHWAVENFDWPGM